MLARTFQAEEALPPDLQAEAQLLVRGSRDKLSEWDNETVPGSTWHREDTPERRKWPALRTSVPQIHTLKS